MPTDVGAVLLYSVSRAEESVGVLGAASTLDRTGLVGAPDTVCNPDDALATSTGLWFVTDLPQLLADRGEWLRRTLDDLRSVDAHLVVVSTDREASAEVLDDLGWSVESVTAVDPGASDQAGVVVLRASAPGGAAAQHDPSPRPFLSVVMRTQGRKPAALDESLTALSAQTCDDFELILVGHDVDDDGAARLRERVGRFPESFADRVRVLTLHGGGRSAPLNAGFEAATGRYLAMLDDDDVPFAHWVATFADLARESPGRVLRSGATVQATSPSLVNGRDGVRAEHGLVFPFPDRYRLARHLIDNATPNMAVAIPGAAFRAYGMRVDDTLSTHEDWEFITRATNTFGTVSSPQCTALYRWWAGAESSRTVQSDADREHNIAEVHRRHEENGVLFQGTDLVELRESMVELEALRQTLVESSEQHRAETDQLRADLAAGEAASEARIRQLRDEFSGALLKEYTRHEECREIRRREAEAWEAEGRERVELLERLAAMLRSRRWRYSAPLRTVQRVRRGSAELRIEQFVGLSNRELHDVIYDVTRTLSWRLGERVRRTTRLLRPGR